MDQSLNYITYDKVHYTHIFKIVVFSSNLENFKLFFRQDLRRGSWFFLLDVVMKQNKAQLMELGERGSHLVLSVWPPGAQISSTRTWCYFLEFDTSHEDLCGPLKTSQKDIVKSNAAGEKCRSELEDIRTQRQQGSNNCKQINGHEAQHWGQGRNI